MIYIVATALTHGKGGISTALTSVVEELDRQAVAYQFIESHSEQISKLQSIRKARRELEAAGADDIVWLHGARWLSLLRKYLLSRGPKRRGARIVMQLHGIEVAHYLNFRLGRWLLQRLINRCDALVVLTPWWQSTITQYLDYPPERILVMPNTLDASLSALVNAPSVQSSERTTTVAKTRVNVLCMTRLEPGKNVDAAIQAMQHLPAHYHLHVAGDGSLLNELKAETEALNLSERVHFLGWVPYQEKPELLQRMDLFLLPSALDSFGMVFLEAMAAGLPVVGLAYGPVCDVVPPTAGKLVSEPSTQLIASAVEECMASHSEMSQAAKEHVKAAFSPEPVVTNTLEFFASLTR
ncbi:MAG: hypothetical protein CMF22_07540 [Idiomarinaceae bacterium]|nr:hypothetical protein [Idiomarinaceae bacterium]|tara:strand:- start:8402 stop:9460 length:1059 start_codon:yes stop_codon:yes gene_type:complete